MKILLGDLLFYNHTGRVLFTNSKGKSLYMAQCTLPHQGTAGDAPVQQDGMDEFTNKPDIF